MGIKRRDVKKNYVQTTVEEQIEKFTAGADGEAVKPAELDKNAKRTFKAMQVVFNEWEFKRLEAACEATGRSKLGFVRFALLKVIDEILK